MSKLHYDHRFNKALSGSIVIFIFFTLISDIVFGLLAFVGFWIGYNLLKK